MGADRQTDRMMEDVGSGMGSKERPREGLSLRKREPESREEEALEGGDVSLRGFLFTHAPLTGDRGKTLMFGFCPGQVARGHPSLT